MTDEKQVAPDLDALPADCCSAAAWSVSVYSQ